MDKLTKEQRSWNMSRIKSKDTLPEMLVRHALWHMGYRYRLYYKKLPGKPDIVMPKYKTVIFVHGCFWHRHENCKEASRPKSNSEYWENKIGRNVERDKKNIDMLEQLGWKVIVIWECQIDKNVDNAISFLKKILIENNILSSKLKNGTMPYDILESRA
ncbi:MAG: very short patch repair endonuclease [Spirochaetaceae bacterium]|jgi:DNA mismatch endonuclease (patch repair protein)|nr:very short patch repair endonuclease [Spirochaetaceae bacterium]